MHLERSVHRAERLLRARGGVWTITLEVWHLAAAVLAVIVWLHLCTGLGGLEYLGVVFGLCLLLGHHHHFCHVYLLVQDAGGGAECTVGVYDVV